jgi:hypothetical protein
MYIQPLGNKNTYLQKSALYLKTNYFGICLTNGKVGKSMNKQYFNIISATYIATRITCPLP